MSDMIDGALGLMFVGMLWCAGYSGFCFGRAAELRRQMDEYAKRKANR
jgi:hypothetical protein